MGARLLALIATVLAVCILLTGCGGSGGASGTSSNPRAGSLRLNITWPDRNAGRNIPKLTNLLHLIIRADGVDVPLVEQDVTKPADGKTQSVVAFKDLPTDKRLTLECQAKGGQAETDTTLLGTASDSVTIHPGVPAVAVLNLVSTIASIEIDLDGAPATGDLHMYRHQSVTVTATPKDADGALVPVAPGSLTVTIAGANLSLTGTTSLQLNSNDVLGNGTLTASEAESGKSSQVNVVIDKRPIASLRIQINGTEPTSDFHMFRNESATVTVTAQDAVGAPVPIDPAYLTIGVTGAALSLTGTTSLQLNSNNQLGSGTLTATESENGKTAQVTIVVDKRIGVKTIQFVPPGPYQLIRTQSLTLVAKGYDEDSQEVPTANFTYSLQNATGLTLNNNVVTATDAGSATVVATETTTNLQTSTTIMALAHGPAVRLGILDASNVEIKSSRGFAAGNSYQLHVASFDALDNEADTPTNVQWSLDEPGGLGNFSLGPNGKLTVKSKAIFGSATVTATAKVNTPSGPVDMTQSITVFVNNN